MKQTKISGCVKGVRVLLAMAACNLVCINASATITVIGTQYRVDHFFPEFHCYYSSSSYPTSCPTNYAPGATAHVFVKNTGASAVTINDATLAGYSLQTVIKMSTANFNPKQQNSIYFYWDNPPQDILDAGEPVWWKADPPTVPAGGVAQVAVRLRRVPTNPIRFGVVSSVNTVNTNLTVDATVPRIQSIGYSDDRKKIYIHWRRHSGGAAPTSVWLNGTNVTSYTSTVGDPALNLAASVITLSNALPYFSYNVYRGIYEDGKTATAGQRCWTNKFIYCSWSTFEANANYDAEDWVNEASAHGFNNIEMNLGQMGGYMGTVAGRNHIQQKNYGYTILDKTKLNPLDPDLWFLNDEPELQENNQGQTHCGTGLRLPCDSSKYVGTLVMKEAVRYTAELRALRPNVPTTVNIDGGLQPYSWYTWGPAVDVLESNNYYEVRLRDSYFTYPQRLPLHNKPKVSYAVARSGTEGAQPNPFRHILYSCKGVDPDWPYPFPASKRIEAYYSLAGGTKGFGYWWFNDPRGLYRSSQAPALWKEMGLIGNEVKTARDLIVKSTPMDLTFTTNSPHIWVRGLASGNDTLMIYVVNDNFVNDINGCHVTNVPNAIVTVTLPLWMQNSPTAFEISAAGLRDVNTVQNGSQFQINLGTLTLTRMIIISTDPTQRVAVQQRYDQHVRGNICMIAPELCTNSPPVINQQPFNRSVILGGTTNFLVVASGAGTLGYRWQKNSTNLNNGGHYSGATTGTLTISNADNNDEANYRCIVSNSFGSVTSSVVGLTIAIPPPVPVASAATSITDTNFVANWAAASGATGYRLDVSANNTFSTFIPGFNDLDVGNTLNRLATGLTGATIYYYRVRAYNGVATSGNSDTITVTTTATSSAPGVPPANAPSGVTDTGFTANWQAAIGANGYRLDVSTNSNFASFLAGYNNLDVGNTLNRALTGLTTGQTFYYRLRAYNGVGTSGNSATIAVTLAPSDPCLLLSNWDFEGGFSLQGGGYIGNSWTEWETDPGVIIGFEETALVRGGARSQRLRVWGGATGSSGGIHQRLPVVAGQPFTVGAWIYTENELTTGSLGVDPTGGTNQNSANVLWSAGTAGASWVHQRIDAAATAGHITVFLKAATTDDAKRNAWFDDVVSEVCVDQPPTITEHPHDQTVVEGGIATFAVTATGASPITYQWLRDEIALADGGKFSGSLTDTLTLTGANVSDQADYRCVVSNALGVAESDAAILTIIVPNPCIPIANPGFENGFTLIGGGYIGNGWTEWETDPGVVIGHDDTDLVQSGDHSQRIRVGGGAGGSSGGVYQSVPVVSGQAYHVGVWMQTDGPQTACALGIDPTGGLDPAGGDILWSAPVTTNVWTQRSWTGTAATDYLTVFLRVSTSDDVERNGWFDGLTPSGTAGSLRLTVQRTGDGLALFWPECPSARLERSGSLVEPADWVSVTNQPSASGGMRSVTLPAVGNEGYYRLVVE